MSLSPKRHAKPGAFFFHVNRKEVWLTVLNMLFYATGSLVGLGSVYFLSKLIDATSSGSGPTRLFALALVASLLLSEGLYRTGHIVEVVLDVRIRQRTKKALFAYVSKLSFGYFTDRFAGQIAHKISNVAESLERMKTNITNTFVDNTLMIVMSAGFLFSIHYAFAVAVIAWLALFIAGLFPLARKLNAASSTFADQESATTGLMVDLFSNISSVKVYGKDSDHGVRRQVDAEASAFKKLGTWSVVVYFYQGMAAVILCCLLLWVTVVLYRTGTVSVGSMVLVGTLALKIFGNVWGLGHSIADFTRSYGECTQNLSDLFGIPAVVDGPEDGHFWDRVSLSFRNVSFSYASGKPVLRDFSLDVPEGQRVGIVGLSGAGKTTLVNLALRFFDPTSGSVAMNGVDIRTMAQSSLRGHISFISQDTSLFHLSILENISYGSPAASRDEVVLAAAAAYAHDFIESLPNGYDTVVGERGVKLSGGQRQRIAIARAILKGSPLFILDEATSALDSDSEAKVQAAIAEMIGGRTVVAIAHRLSTLRAMDRIVFLEDGQIVEDGTHDELVSLGGRYAKLWEMQAGGFLPGE